MKNILLLLAVFTCDNLLKLLKQETAKYGMAGLQSKFQNLNANVNQMGKADHDGYHQSISQNNLTNPAKNCK